MADLPTNLAILTGAGIGAVIAPLIPDRRASAVLTLGAGGVGLIVGIDIALTAKREIEEYGKSWVEAVRSAANLPFGAGSLYEQFAGALGRASGLGPEEGIKSEPDRPATEGAKLGPPKNALRVAGKIRTVENQAPTGAVGVPLFADTLLVDVALENQAGELRTGVLKLESSQKGLRVDFATTSIDRELTLQPGEFQQVTVRIKREAFAALQTDLRLSWEGYTLDRVQFIAA